MQPLPSVILGTVLAGFFAAIAPPAAAQMMPPKGPSIQNNEAMMPRRGMGMNHKPIVRHMWFMRKGIPQQYHPLRNPLPETPDVVFKGKAIYTEHCMSCHGPEGKGDGEAGKELQPPPTDLSFIIVRPVASDPFLFWTITEGGAPLGTDMPVFADVLSEEERWAVIRYLRIGIAPKPDTSEW